MTLRAEIRDAVDEVTPPARHLERNVRAFVFANGRERQALRLPRRRRGWTYRLQGLGVAVAAALVVALIAGLVLGGRFWRDLNAPPATVNQSALKYLESLPVTLPKVASEAVCPKTPINERHPGLVAGDGPTFIEGHDPQAVTSWGNWGSVIFNYEPRVAGPVLVRARDLVTGQDVVFASYPVGKPRLVPAGAVLGSDYVFELNATLTMRSEGVLADVDPAEKLVGFKALIGESTGGSGCIGFQLNGPGFVNRLVIDQPTPWKP